VAWGIEPVMSRAEQEGLAYLFRLRMTANVKRALETVALASWRRCSRLARIRQRRARGGQAGQGGSPRHPMRRGADWSAAEAGAS
jgi:hypothetical protein